MKMKKMVYSFFLHYGISAVLVFMFCMAAIMLNRIEISNRTNADVFIDCIPVCKAYISKNHRLELHRGNSIHIDIAGGKTLSFTIQDITVEHDFFVIRIISENNSDDLIKTFSGNSRLSGYVYTHRIKLRDLIFARFH